MITRVVNLKKDQFDVYIGRGSLWGNPYKIGPDGTRKECIDKYREYAIIRGINIRAKELKGKTLGCFCKPLACHGDLLAMWAEDE